MTQPLHAALGPSGIAGGDAFMDLIEAIAAAKVRGATAEAEDLKQRAVALLMRIAGGRP